jgi:hypothetical protein
MWGWLQAVLAALLSYLDIPAKTRRGATSVDPTAGGRRDTFRRIVWDRLRRPGRADRP